MTRDTEVLETRASAAISFIVYDIKLSQRFARRMPEAIHRVAQP
jgi:hypothetical protein